LIFSEENRILSGQVWFNKFVVNDSADVTTRLSTAFLATIESGVYVEALFFYNNTLFEVAEINVAKSNVYIYIYIVNCSCLTDYPNSE
jgi:hypothetical protein